MWIKSKSVLAAVLTYHCVIVYGYRKHYHDGSLCSHSHNHETQTSVNNKKLQEVFSWKQIEYDFDGVLYKNDSSNSNHTPDSMDSSQELNQRYYIKYNNVPIGMEVYRDRLFITVPRRRHGIPSTLNYVQLDSSSSPLLKPYPDTVRSKSFISVYRPRVDACHRLWMVDTGLLEIPDARKQIQTPAIVVFDLKTNDQILRYELKASDLVNERTPGGLSSITVDVSPFACDDAFAYINDLATEGLIVFSLRKKDSWRISDETFKHDEKALNFTVAGNIITWKDGLFSIALSEPDMNGKRVAYYHPLVSTQEFSIETDFLKMERTSIEGKVKMLGNRGNLTQSGSHSYHRGTRTLLFANVAQDAILCWNVDTELIPENVAIVSQDHQKLVYISDLKIVRDEVWILVNQIPRFVFSTLNPDENNYYVLRGNIPELIKDTVCDVKRFK